MAARMILTLLRFGVGAMFTYAGTVKIWDFSFGDWATQAFAQAVQNYQLTPWDASVLIAVYVPWVEFIGGIALLSRRLYFGALVALLGLTSLFIAALVSAWVRGLDITCGCFAPENNRTNYPLHISGNIVLLIILSALLWSAAKRARLPSIEG